MTDTAETMVERAAEAVRTIGGTEFATPEEVARAVIAAMRDPTHAVLAAGRVQYAASVRAKLSPQVASESLLIVMLDAALTEDRP